MTQVDRIPRPLAVPPPPLSGGEDDWLDVQALFRVVRRRFGLIFLVGMAVMLAAVPMILGMKKDYAATARILIHEPLPAAFASSALTAEDALNLTTEGERLLSRTISVGVISELDLAARPEFNPTLAEPSLVETARDRLRGLLSTDAAVAPQGDPIDRVLQSYLGHLRIARAPGSDVISIGFVSHDPELAAQVPNTLIRVYLDERERQAASRRARAEGWLQNRIDAQEARLTAAEAELDGARAEMGDTPVDAAGAARDRTDLGAQLTEIERRRSDLTTRLENLAQASGLAARMIAADVDPQLGRALANERAGLEGLLQRYGSAHGEVVAARARIDALESSAEAEIERQRLRMETDLAALDGQQAAVLQDVEAARDAMGQARRMDLRLVQLQEAVDVERDALVGLTEQLRAVRAEAELPPAEIEVLTPAAVPLSAEGRGRSYYLAVAAVAAALLALTVAFGVEMIDTTIRSQQQLSRIPGVGSAGLVPDLPRNVLRRGGRDRLARLYRDRIEAVLLALEQRGNQTVPQSLLVTSALPREGKSTIAAALAEELAASGRKVLLVDADLRRGSLHERFAAPVAPGLSDYLSGRAELDQVIRHDEASGVSFIPRGTATGRPLFDRQLARSLVASAGARGQVAIFDATPVLVANEALLLAGLVARTLLVVRWGRTQRAAVEGAAERLSLRCGQEVDVVISRVDLRRQSLYGYRDAGVLARSLRRYHGRRD